MLNWLRTVLLNQAQGGYGTSVPGEEVVPVAYVPKDLPPVVAKLRRLLFGANPDRYFLNYRLRQLLPLIHSTTLDNTVTEEDSRLTYWPATDHDLFNPSLFVGVAVPLNTEAGTLYLSGEALPDEATGIISRTWNVRVVDAATVQVDAVCPVAASLTVAVTVPSDDTLSEPIPLPGTALYVRLNGTTNGAWLIRHVARPQHDVAYLWALMKQQVTVDDERVLFGAAPAEPYLTLENVWQDHPLAHYQLAALVLALGLRTMEA